MNERQEISISTLVESSFTAMRNKTVQTDKYKAWAANRGSNTQPNIDTGTLFAKLNQFGWDPILCRSLVNDDFSRYLYEHIEGDVALQGPVAQQVFHGSATTTHYAISTSEPKELDNSRGIPGGTHPGGVITANVKGASFLTDPERAQQYANSAARNINKYFDREIAHPCLFRWHPESRIFISNGAGVHSPVPLEKLEFTIDGKVWHEADLVRPHLAPDGSLDVVPAPYGNDRTYDVQPTIICAREKAALKMREEEPSLEEVGDYMVSNRLDQGAPNDEQIAYMRQRQQTLEKMIPVQSRIIIQLQAASSSHQESSSSDTKDVDYDQVNSELSKLVKELKIIKSILPTSSPAPGSYFEDDDTNSIKLNV